MKKDLRVHGLIEFEEFIRKLVDEGISCTSIANVLNETPATINNFKNGLRGITTKTLKKMEETTGMKTFVLIFDGDNEKLFRQLQQIHQRSLEKLEELIREEDKKRRKGRRRTRESNLLEEFTKLAVEEEEKRQSKSRRGGQRNRKIREIDDIEEIEI